MAYRDIDVNVSNETKSMLLQVRKFSLEVLRPAGIQLDRLSSPEEVIAKGSPLWKAFKGFRELDLHLLQILHRRQRSPANIRGLWAGQHD